MVKNFGGNKGKKIARKTITAPKNHKLRTPDPNQPDEHFACVSKLLGNGMCHVTCGDGKDRLCIIRNKFRGRSKRDNTIIPGSFVLIDVRSWETKTDKKDKLEKCDLLEVYNPSEMDRLKDTVSFDWSKFKHIGTFSNDNISNSGDDVLAFEFTDNDNTDLMNNIEQDTQHILKTEDLIDNSDEINIDDI